MHISFEQRQHIGYQAVVELLEPASPYGREALRRLVPYEPDQRQALQDHLDNIEKTLTTRPALERPYKRLEQVFRQVKDIRGTLSRCEQGDLLGEVELFEIKRFLIQLCEIAPLFEEIDDRARYISIGFPRMEEALSLLDPEGNRVASFHISGRYSPALTQIRREKREVEQIMREASRDEKEDLGIRRSALVAREQEEEEAVRTQLTRQLKPYAGALLESTRTIARLDLLLQQAALAQRYGCCKPHIGGGAIRLVEMINPQIDRHLKAQGKAFTPLTMELSKGVTVITGANMGGKSVALKTAALQVLLIHCGFYAFAGEARCPLFHTMHLVSEDLEATDRGLSSFGGEIVRLGEVLESFKKGLSIAFLDEFARGTNPREGAAIARGVAEYLDGLDAFTLMTTHYDGVSQVAGAHYQVVGLSGRTAGELEAEMAASSPQGRVDAIARCMDYGLVPVTTAQALPRDAVTICRLLGLDKPVMDRIEKNLDTGLTRPPSSV